MKNRLDQLTITQIVDAFPDECRDLIPKVNRTLKRSLQPYLQRMKSVRNRHHDQTTEKFLLQVMKLEYKPEATERQIKRNEAILNHLIGPKDGRVNDSMIEEAKRVPILSLYDFEKVKPGHHRWVSCCPFHTESTGSFTVYENNTYFCFGACGHGGDSIDFVMRLHGFKFIDAVKHLADQ